MITLTYIRQLDGVVAAEPIYSMQQTFTVSETIRQQLQSMEKQVLFPHVLEQYFHEPLETGRMELHAIGLDERAMQSCIQKWQKDIMTPICLQWEIMSW